MLRYILEARCHPGLIRDGSLFMFIQHPHQLQNPANKAVELRFEAYASDPNPHLPSGSHCSPVQQGHYSAGVGRLGGLD